MSFNDDIRAAYRAYYQNKKVREDFEKKSVSDSKRRARNEAKSSATFSSRNPDKLKQYNDARKEMGLSSDDSINKKQYDNMFGVNHIIGHDRQTTDTGMYNRWKQQNKETARNATTPKKSSPSFGQKVDNTFDSIVNFVKKNADKKEINLYKKAIQSNPVQGALKGIDTIDRYSSGILRNIADTNVNDLKETQKYIDKQHKEGKSGKLKTQSFDELKSVLKKSAKDSIEKGNRADFSDTLNKAGVSTGSKVGDELLGFIAENVVDPTNIVGAGVAKGVSKAGGKALNKIAQDVSKQAAKDAASNPELIKLLQSTPRKELTKQNLPAQFKTLTPQEKNLRNIELPNERIEVTPGNLRGINEQLGRVQQNQPPIEVPRVNRQVDASNEPIQTPETQVTPREQFEQRVQQSIPQQPNALQNMLDRNTENTIERTMQSNEPTDILKSSDDITKEIESFHTDDDELNLLNDELKGLKLNLQTFASNPEKQAELLKRIQRINSQADTLIKSRQRAENVKNMTVSQKKEYDANRHQADIDYLQGKLDDLDRLSNSSVGGELSPQVEELKANLQSRLQRKQAALTQAELPLTQREQFQDNATELLNKVGDGAKDKSMFALNSEAPIRLVNEVFQDGGRTFKENFEPIQYSEADKIKEMQNLEKDVKSKLKEWKIKPGSKDDELIQKYGEKVITLDELKRETKNWENVVKGADYAADIYKNYITRMNEALVRNGYDPIPIRENYFPHYTSKNKNIVANLFGVDLTNHKLPTDINGITEQFKPGKNWFANALKRTGEKTDYGFTEGLSDYANGAGNIIHHTDNIQRLRQFKRAIDRQYGGSEGRGHLSNFNAWLEKYTDRLAGKKGAIDRVAEESIGRGAFNLASTLSRNIGNAVVGGSLSSATSGFIPITTAFASTNKTAMAKAMAQTVSNIFKKDGFETPFMIRREGANPIYMNKAQKVKDKSFALMRGVDNLATNIIVRGKYNEGISKGMTEEGAKKYADTYAMKVMADRSKGQVPAFFDQRTLDFITKFQLEVGNQISHIVKDIPSMAKANSKTKKATVAKMVNMYTQLAISGYLFNELYEKTTGRRMAFDPIEYAKKAIQGNSLGAFEDIAGQVPGTSLLIEGRSPMQSALPEVSEIKDRVEQQGGGLGGFLKEGGLSLLKSSPYLLGVPGYGQAKKTYEGVQAYKKGASQTDSGMLRYPIEQSTPKAIQTSLFGQYAPKEAKQYFDFGVMPLQGKRQAAVENTPKKERQQEYYQQLINRIEDSKKRNKGNNEKLEKLNKQLKKIKDAKKEK